MRLRGLGAATYGWGAMGIGFLRATPIGMGQVLGRPNTLIGNVNNAEKPIAKAAGCWDDDTLDNLSFTNIQVRVTGRDTDNDGKSQRVSFTQAKWKVQGVYGTN